MFSSESASSELDFAGEELTLNATATLDKIFDNESASSELDLSKLERIL